MTDDLTQQAQEDKQDLSGIAAEAAKVAARLREAANEVARYVGSHTFVSRTENEVRDLLLTVYAACPPAATLLEQIPTLVERVSALIERTEAAENTVRLMEAAEAEQVHEARKEAAALRDENERLRAELQARKPKPVEPDEWGPAV